MRSQGRGESPGHHSSGRCVDDCLLHFLKHTGISLEAGSNHLVFSTLKPSPLGGFFLLSLIWLSVFLGRSDLISPNAAAAAKTLSSGNVCSPSEILSVPTIDNLCINLSLDHTGTTLLEWLRIFQKFSWVLKADYTNGLFAVVNN